jgi:ferredoxin
MDCVEVCPVDCFYEGENFLVINPDECIDCGVCQPECPVDAIVPDNDVDTDIDKWLGINQKYSLLWPVITKRRPADVPQDASAWNGVADKYKEHFSEKPGKGNN